MTLFLYFGTLTWIAAGERIPGCARGTRTRCTVRGNRALRGLGARIGHNARVDARPVPTDFLLAAVVVTATTGVRGWRWNRILD